MDDVAAADCGAGARPARGGHRGRAAPPGTRARSGGRRRDDHLRIAGGTVYDPANGIDGEVRDVCIADGRVVADVDRGRDDYRRARHGRDAGRRRHPFACRQRQRQRGAPSAARGTRPRSSACAALVEGEAGDGRAPAARCRARSRPATATPASVTRRCSMPRWRRSRARLSHAEFDDTPIVDGGFFVLMGNDEYLMRQIDAGEREPRARVRGLAARRGRRLCDQDRQSRRHRAMEARSSRSHGSRHAHRLDPRHAARDPRDSGRRRQRAAACRMPRTSTATTLAFRQRRDDTRQHACDVGGAARTSRTCSFTATRPRRARRRVAIRRTRVDRVHERASEKRAAMSVR